MENGETWEGFVPLRGKPKARPQVTSHGTFMPRPYREWRQDFGQLLMLQHPRIYREQPIGLEVEFGSDEVRIKTYPLFEAIRPKHVRADVDNLIGGVMEVLEDIHVVENDKQIYVVKASVLKPRR